MANIDDLDLVTTCELTNTQTAKTKGAKKAKQCYHFIYGSQLYGTLFGVFGRFTTRKVKGETSLEIRKLTLQIVNYQGLLNIGFKKKPIKYKESAADGKTIGFGVQGGSRIMRKVLKFKKGELIVKKGERSRITFNRLLYPLAGFDPGGNERQPLPPRKESDVLFDTEFHYRNGVDHYYQILRDGMAHRRDLKSALTFPALRCVQSVVNLYH